MPRRAEIPVRELIPDPVYGSKLVTQLMNKVMLDGKKSTAEGIVYIALERVGEKTGRPPVEGLRAGHQARPAGARGSLAARRRRQLPGAYRGARPPRSHPRHP